MQCGPKRTHYFRPSARQTRMAIEKDPVGVFHFVASYEKRRGSS